MSKTEQRRRSAFAKGMKDRRNAEKNIIKDNTFLEDEKWIAKPQKSYLWRGAWNAGWAEQGRIIKTGR